MLHTAVSHRLFSCHVNVEEAEAKQEIAVEDSRTSLKDSLIV